MLTTYDYKGVVAFKKENENIFIFILLRSNFRIDYWQKYSITNLKYQYLLVIII